MGAEAVEVGGIGGGLFKGYWGQKQLRLAGLGEVYSKVIGDCGGHKKFREATGDWERFIQRLLGTAGDISSGRPPGIGGGYSKVIGDRRGHKQLKSATRDWRRLFKGYWGRLGT